jgi:Tfp pilus assembly protein FimT
MSRQSKHRRVRGYTAIELVVVMGIVSTISGLAFQGFQAVRLASMLSSAQRAAVAALQTARWKAINSGVVHTVSLSTANAIEVTKGGGTVESLPLDGYSVSQTHTGASTFDFDPRGFIPAGTTAPITITLENTLGATRTVTVDRLGRITTS